MTIGKKTKAALKGNFAPARDRVAFTPGGMVRTLRELHELTQEALAQQCGWTQSVISAVESDRVRLGVHRAEKLGNVLNVHPGKLLFPNWKPNKEKKAA